MPQLDEYFTDEVEPLANHPLLRFLSEQATRPDFQDAKVEVVCSQALIGSRPTKLVLHLYARSGEELIRPQDEEWDDELNTVLIHRKVRGISLDNEKIRFSLGLSAALEGTENRFGDGYYNSVLVHHIQNSPFKGYPAVAEVLPHVYRNGVDPSARSYDECRDMIDGAIRGRAMELTRYLGYPIPEAEDILATAIARYLDDRFSVSNRRAFGWL